MQINRSEEIENRCLIFSVNVIKYANSNRVGLPFSVIDQVTRSSSSVGANYSEAQNASSKADFKNKIYIAKKEASETRFWLRLIQKLLESSDMDDLIDESHQILMILQKIINTLNEKSAL